MEIETAPPRELENMAMAFPVGMSFSPRTTWTAMKGTVSKVSIASFVELWRI